MPSKLRFAVGAGLIVLAIGYLITTAVRNTSEYYLTVNEVGARQAHLTGQMLRVAGRVKAGTISWDPATVSRAPARRAQPRHVRGRPRCDRRGTSCFGRDDRGPPGAYLLSVEVHSQEGQVNAAHRSTRACARSSGRGLFDRRQPAGYPPQLARPGAQRPPCAVGDVRDGDGGGCRAVDVTSRQRLLPGVRCLVLQCSTSDPVQDRRAMGRTAGLAAVLDLAAVDFHLHRDFPEPPA